MLARAGGCVHQGTQAQAVLTKVLGVDRLEIEVSTCWVCVEGFRGLGGLVPKAHALGP